MCDQVVDTQRHHGFLFKVTHVNCLQFDHEEIFMLQKMMSSLLSFGRFMYTSVAWCVGKSKESGFHYVLAVV